ncbi:hypothetical protein LBMAG42_16610 [Deltaproteobacteria bacterium]|nr:hypothetical protein LBMAG42_16610 [Deltaproteobacteria bacterium]
MKNENTLFWRYDAASPTPAEREASAAERAALAEVLRCLPVEVCQLASRFDGATDAGNAMLNSSLALTRHLNNLLNSWYLAAADAHARAIAERKLVAFSLAPKLSYGKEMEGLRTLLATHASAGSAGWPELTELAAAPLPPECGLYKVAAKAIGETMAEMPSLQADYLQNMVARHVRANVVPTVTVLEFLGATVPLRNETTGHNLWFSPVAAAVVARYLAPALRAFLMSEPVRTAMTRVRIGRVVRMSSASHVEVELDTQGPGWPSEVFELDAVGMPSAVETRVVVRLASGTGRDGYPMATYAARYAEFPKPLGNPQEAERKVQVEVLSYLLRDGVPPPAGDALKALDGTGWTPATPAEQEEYVTRAAKPILEAYTRWLVAFAPKEALAGVALTAADRELLARVDPEFASLPADAARDRLHEHVAAGGEARRKLVHRLLAEPSVSVSDFERAIGDPALTLLTLHALQENNEVASDIPWAEIHPLEQPQIPEGHFSVWIVRARIQEICGQLGNLRDSGGLSPGRPVPWDVARVLVEALRELVDTTLSHKDFPADPVDGALLGKECMLAILDDLLTSEGRLDSVPTANPGAAAKAPEAPPEPERGVPPPLQSPGPVETKEGLRLAVGGDEFRARGITGIYRELARAFTDRPKRLARLADLAGPPALFATDRSLFYTPEQLAAGVNIRQPVRLQIAGRPLYFEGSISADVGLLHLARLLDKSGIADVVAWIDGCQVYPIQVVAETQPLNGAAGAPPISLEYASTSSQGS